jgi:hypothetical protein
MLHHSMKINVVKAASRRLQLDFLSAECEANLEAGCRSHRRIHSNRRGMQHWRLPVFAVKRAAV